MSKSERREANQSAAWPSLKEQLASAAVVPGSALERLIRENQNFHLLRPEEARDRIGIPAWLRVHWRKHHPKSVYTEGDPTGGYPRALNTVLGEMLLQQDLEGLSS